MSKFSSIRDVLEHLENVRYSLPATAAVLQFPSQIDLDSFFI